MANLIRVSALLAAILLSACAEDKGCVYSIHIGTGNAPPELPEGYSSFCEPSTEPYVPVWREAYTPRSNQDD